MTAPEFTPWPKIARLNRDIVITEKIDGTNAAVVVTDDLEVFAQSRTRIITPGDDNFGFASWVSIHAADLAKLLGPGVHFGEWWGSGIQRGYGLPRGERRFSLFNTNRWTDADLSAIEALEVVPVLYEGPFSQAAVTHALVALAYQGSFAGNGFKRPEGVVVYHKAARTMFKVTLENDDAPKGQTT